VDAGGSLEERDGVEQGGTIGQVSGIRIGVAGSNATSVDCPANHNLLRPVDCLRSFNVSNHLLRACSCNKSDNTHRGRGSDSSGGTFIVGCDREVWDRHLFCKFHQNSGNTMCLGGGAARVGRAALVGGGGAGTIVTERFGGGLTNADEPLNDTVGSIAVVRSGGGASGSNGGSGGAGGSCGTEKLGIGSTNADKPLHDTVGSNAVVRSGGGAAGSNGGGGGAGTIVMERLGGGLTNADEPLNDAVGSNAVVQSGGGAAGSSEKLGGGSTKGTGCDGANVNSFVANPSADFVSALNQCPRNATATRITMQAGKKARNFERFCSSFASNVPLNEAAVA
jgi:hypothetical protein